METPRRPPLPEGPFLVVGMARSGVAAARTLRARGETVIATDSAAVGPEVVAELEALGVVVAAGTDGLELLGDARCLVKSPGVPAEAPVIAAARAAQVPVLGELELGWRLLPNETIAVTGSNGKTTVTKLLGHLHRTAQAPVQVAGNVGTALSGLVGTLDPAATIVAEASSFQLEDTVAFAPEAAALLNLTPDHLDRHGTLAAYLAAKLRVFAHQRPGDVAVVPHGFDADRVAAAAGGEPSAAAGPFGSAGSSGAAGGTDTAGSGQAAGSSGAAGSGDAAGSAGAAPPAATTGFATPGAGGATVVTFGGEGADLEDRGDALAWRGEALIATDAIRLPGLHNRRNAMAAAALVLARGMDPAAVRAGLETFAGVAHRLETVATADGVTYVNDSKATNVDAAITGIGSYAAGVHAILGGHGPDGDLAALAAIVAERATAAYLIGASAHRLEPVLRAAGVPAVTVSGDLERAVAQARAAARPGETVLLSPAYKSFDQYADFEARGEHFRALAAGDVR